MSSGIWISEICTQCLSFWQTILKTALQASGACRPKRLLEAVWSLRYATDMSPQEWQTLGPKVIKLGAAIRAAVEDFSGSELSAIAMALRCFSQAQAPLPQEVWQALHNGSEDYTAA